MRKKQVAGRDPAATAVLRIKHQRTRLVEAVEAAPEYLALEPHLGLACDPEGARIQQPCIERNATAAARAVTAAQNAMRQPAPRNALDALTRSMVDRGRGMAGRFKQASLGGITVNVADC